MFKGEAKIILEELDGLSMEKAKKLKEALETKG
jgi:hypothetical protein